MKLIIGWVIVAIIAIIALMAGYNVDKIPLVMVLFAMATTGVLWSITKI